jgi:uncharacterized protein YecT (DUF1311 family)
MKRSVILILAMSLSSAAEAAIDPDVVNALLQTTKGISREIVVENHDKCDSGVTFSMKICLAYRWMVEDVRMNRVYKKAITTGRRVGASESLRRSQRAWIAFRDAECTFQGKVEAGGGSAEGLSVLACKQNLTRLRADQLTAY